MPACPETLAAVLPLGGASRRMGRIKALLPWGEDTVLAAVLGTLHQAGLRRVVAVTGAHRERIQAELGRLRPRFPGLETVHNPGWEAGEMLSSVQTGLRALPPTVQAALIVLADQPQMEAETVRQLCAAWERTRRGAVILVPSFQLRRGHPWLVSRPHWPAILSLDPARHTLRDFLNARQDEIRYLVVHTPSVLQDLDTPEDYRRQRPDLPPDAR